MIVDLKFTRLNFIFMTFWAYLNLDFHNINKIAMTFIVKKSFDIKHKASTRWMIFQKKCFGSGSSTSRAKANVLTQEVQLFRLKQMF